MLKINLYTLNLCLQFVHSTAVLCVGVTVALHIKSPCSFCTSQMMLLTRALLIQCRVVVKDVFMLVLFVVRQALNAYVCRWRCCTFL